MYMYYVTFLPHIKGPHYMLTEDSEELGFYSTFADACAAAMNHAKALGIKQFQIVYGMS